MAANAKVIAVDLGASGGKCFAGLFDDNGFVAEGDPQVQPRARRAAPGGPYRPGGGALRLERPSHLRATLWKDCAPTGGRSATRVDSVGIDTWGADGVFVTEDGVALGPMYCYRDHRLDGMVDQVKARMDARRLYEITGIHFQPFNLSNQLLWFMSNRQGLVRKDVRFLPAPTLFSYYLGGVTAVDSSWASVTQLMDARRKKWSREILRALGIPARVMPSIVAPGTVVGALRAGLAESVGTEPREDRRGGISRHGKRVCRRAGGAPPRMRSSSARARGRWSASSCAGRSRVPRPWQPTSATRAASATSASSRTAWAPGWCRSCAGSGARATAVRWSGRS